MSDDNEDDGAVGGVSGAGGDMNREDQFARVLHNTLIENGELNKLKSSMRATILNVVRNGERGAFAKIKEKNRNLPTDLVNKLIMDYFHWYGYHYSVEMFSTESGTIHTDCPNRAELVDSIGIEVDRDVPVLLMMIIKMLSTGGCDVSK